MPASPDRSTTWPSPFFAFAQRRSSSSHSSSRPTRAVRPLACSASKRLSTELGRSTAQTRTGSGDALEVSCSEVLQLEKIAEKPSCALGDNDHVRLGKSLQTRREVRRLADDATLLRGRRSDQVADHDQAGRNADTGLQRNSAS